MHPAMKATDEILRVIRSMENELQTVINLFKQDLKANNLSHLSKQRYLMHDYYTESFEEAIKGILESERAPDVYYDETSDNQQKAAYYKDIYFEEESNVLKSKLEDLITRTHKNHLTYSQSKKELHSWVDLHEDRKARSIYSGKSMEANTLLAEDLIYEAAVRKELIKHASLKNVIEQSLETILLTLSLNVEHVIPQSWFKKANPMVADLHHLFSCEMTCNSFRSNIPYYDFADYNPSASKEIIRNDCGKRDGEERFEPQNGKGAVARATMYFLTRYPAILPQERMRLIDIPMLVKWHQDHPVSLYEKHRNWSIFQLQGNRNPFIDFPDTANALVQ